MTVIRRARQSDPEGFLDLVRALDAETSFMLLEPGERTSSVEDVRERLRWFESDRNGIRLVAEHEGRLVGYLDAVRGEFRRSAHSAYLVTGILKSSSGQGLGRRFFAALDEWASTNGVRRLELTVMVHNERAIRLYRKAGFEIEGTKRESLLVDGAPVDEFYMAKLLP